jgi:hypothetical protein
MNTTSAATASPLVRFTSFFEPDILTTHQYLKVYRQKSQFDPEERLMFAVLTDAIECFQKYIGSDNPRSRRLSAEAEAWITNQDASWPYSFEHICQVLNLSPGYLRLGLMQWRSAHVRDRNPRKRIREPLRYQYRVKSNRMSM